MSPRRPAALALVLALGLGFSLAVALGACGRKADLRPPDGRADEYVYPRTYPAPSSVLPPLEEGAEESASGDSSGS